MNDNNKQRPWLIVGIVALLVVIAILIFFLVRAILGSSESETPATTDESWTSRICREDRHTPQPAAEPIRLGNTPVTRNESIPLPESLHQGGLATGRSTEINGKSMPIHDVHRDPRHDL